uniref:LISCH7 domain-containing protein n=1 Tax=Sinocyclocheilus rhinocerous TaxID=307959 RepID=A0A673H2D3_9TELE
DLAVFSLVEWVFVGAVVMGSFLVILPVGNALYGSLTVRANVYVSYSAFVSVLLTHSLRCDGHDGTDLAVFSLVEWVFVGAVVMGSFLVILPVGVCWCQYTWCCPQHLYEAGKVIKTTPPTPVPMFPPYYIPGMPTMVNRQTYRQVQKKALPTIPDLDDLRTTDLSPISLVLLNNEQFNSIDNFRFRWNPRSEHLQRKAFLERGRTGSLDELEEFAMAYMDVYRASPVRCPPSPTPLPGKRRGPWGNGQPQRDTQKRDQSRRDFNGTGSRQDYSDALLNSLLERKAKAVKSSSSKVGHNEEDSDTPSKKSSEGFHSRSPCNQSPRDRMAEDNESLPSYTEKEQERSSGAESGQQPFSYTCSGHGSTASGQEEQNCPRKVVSYL